jgi:transposase-like protein
MMAGFLGLDEVFEGRHVDREVIVLCVRWYLRFALSFRDLVEMMAERGLSIDHTTIMRWVHHYSPEFERRWSRFARAAGCSWRVDETYVKIRGEWVCLYRAVDREGKTVDFRLSGRRDVTAAKAFFREAIKCQGSAPRTITLDGYAASHRAVREMKADGELSEGMKVRSSKYLNNIVEQDHRGVKLRVGPMLGFKCFRTAAITISGIEGIRSRKVGPLIDRAPGSDERHRETHDTGPGAWDDDRRRSGRILRVLEPPRHRGSDVVHDRRLRFHVVRGIRNVRDPVHRPRCCWAGLHGGLGDDLQRAMDQWPPRNSWGSRHLGMGFHRHAPRRTSDRG